jgi:hypothetical protein
MVDMTSLDEGGRLCLWVLAVLYAAVGDAREKQGLLCFFLDTYLGFFGLRCFWLWKGQVVLRLWSFVGLSWSEDWT